MVTINLTDLDFATVDSVSAQRLREGQKPMDEYDFEVPVFELSDTWAKLLKVRPFSYPAVPLSQAARIFDELFACATQAPFHVTNSDNNLIKLWFSSPAEVYPIRGGHGLFVNGTHNKSRELSLDLSYQTNAHYDRSGFTDVQAYRVGIVTISNGIVCVLELQMLQVPHERAKPEVLDMLFHGGSVSMLQPHIYALKLYSMNLTQLLGVTCKCFHSK